MFGAFFCLFGQNLENLKKIKNFLVVPMFISGNVKVMLEIVEVRGFAWNYFCVDPRTHFHESALF